MLSSNINDDDLNSSYTHITKHIHHDVTVAGSTVLDLCTVTLVGSGFPLRGAARPEHVLETAL